MCSTIEHRGPDSHGAFCEDGVGLGIQRLAVIDLQTGDQPVFNEDESVVVVLNGEIYNYVELREQLRAAGHHFRSQTDTEVIVHLYEEYGDACVEHLRGMFAFALWDRPRRRLLLARDRLGKKPLFYAERDGVLWFGSETKAILQDPDVPRDVDYAAIDSYLQLGYVPSPRSAFASLRKLPPAHVAVWEGQAVVQRRYWKLSYATRTSGTEAEMQELVRDELLEATRLRLRSDVPLGAFLSGGVDSTVVVAAMAQEASGTVRTFSIGFDEDSHDETRYAAEVAQLFGTEHHELTVEPSAIEVLPELAWHYGEPFADASAVPTYYLAQMTSGQVTVALNGDGGDENFAGYVRYLTQDVIRRFEWLPRPAAAAVARNLAKVVGRGHGPRPLRQARWLAEGLMDPLPRRYAAGVSTIRPDQRAGLYTPEFQRAIAGAGAPDAGALFAAILAESTGEDVVEQLLDIDVNTYLPDDLLVKVDIASMAHSLEVRSPLLDHRFMETVAGLPRSVKQKGRAQKRLLKDVARHWVPDHILDRKKQGFSPPLASWLRGDLKDLAATILLDPRAVDRGLLEPQRVRALIDDHVQGRDDNAEAIWTMLQLELWFRTYVDGAAPAPLASL